ncbi:MAG: hypothetical protein R3C68_08740 [Myxococcota bacterium]
MNCPALESTPLDLSNVEGQIILTFYAKYLLEQGFDGVTAVFNSAEGQKPRHAYGGWDTDHVMFKTVGSCAYTFTDLPGFGQYQTANTIGWQEKRFVIDSEQSPEFFHSNFYWRLYLQSDQDTVDAGFYLDDVRIEIIRKL